MYATQPKIFGDRLNTDGIGTKVASLFRVFESHLILRLVY